MIDNLLTGHGIKKNKTRVLPREERIEFKMDLTACGISNACKILNI